MITRSYETNEYWGICGLLGLYVGTWSTRKEAIDAHVLALFGTYQLQNNRAKAWKECRAKGDRATKLRIIYEWKK